MTFPVIETSQTSVYIGGNNARPITMPSGVNVGDLLIVLAVADGNPTFSWPSGWNVAVAKANSSAEVTAEVRYRIADGSEGASISLTLGSVLKSAHIALRISGFDSGNPVAAGGSATGATASPNPPNIAPGGSVDYLYLEMFGADDDDETSVYESTSYTQVAQIESDQSSSACMAACAYQNLNATSENPGVMHLGATEEWVAFTLAIPPAGAPPSYVPSDPCGRMGFFGV